MATTSCGRSRRHALLLATTVLISGLAAPALAQTAPAPEPFRNNDARGVDMVTGSYNFEMTEGDIGPASAGVTLKRYWGRSGWRDNWSGDLRITSPGGLQTATITFGKISDVFTRSGANWVSAKADGATLTDIPEGYRYQRDDGTSIVYALPSNLFTSNDTTGGQIVGCGAGNASTCAFPTAITDPDGSKYTLTWTFGESCTYDAQLNATCTVSYRLQDVRNRTSYAMKFKYRSDKAYTGTPTNQSPPPPSWNQRSTAKFLDLSQVYCDPAAMNCDSVAGTWPTVTYAYPSGTVTNVTDERGGTWVLTTNGGSAVTAVRRPGATADTTTITRGTDGRVSQIVDDGTTTNYVWTGTGTTTVTATTGAGEVDTVVSTPAAAQPTTTTNATSNATQFTYDANQRLTRETRPEGDYTNYTYDTRGNVTETRVVAKPGSGIADIVATASYDASCTNAATCNSPNYTIDPKGNRTDYSYDATHGGVIRVQQPAPAAGGVRPETNYGYTALYPQVRDASNALINGPTPEYKVTQITRCATAATCAGTANETRTTIAYATPNLLVSAVTVASGDGTLSATTAYTYDALDNVKTVDGPLPGSDDTTTYFYDASSRQRGMIGPDPDGTGMLKRRAVRNSFDAQSRVIKVERGAVTGTADADLNGMAAVETLDIAYDANGNKTRETLSAGGTTYAVTQYSYDADNRLSCTAVRMNSAVFGSLPASACTASTAGTAGPDRITKTLYDANSRVTKVQRAFGTTDQADEVTATYTANGQTATVADGLGNLTTYIYDGFDRLSRTRYPLAANGAASSTTDYDGLSYDANSNVTQRRLRDGQVLAFAYDALDRVTVKTVPSGVYFENSATYSYDNLSRLTAVGSAVPLVLGYDALGRQTSEGSNSLTKTVQYDLAGRATRITWPDGFFARYDRLVTGEVSAVRENGATSGPGVLGSYAYDDLGRLTGLTRGNGVVSSWGYDPVSRLASLGHDLAGTANDVSTAFAYSPASQIASSTRNNDGYAWGGHYNVNRNYTVNGLNQLTAAGSVSLTHDGRGNVSSQGATTYGYTSENRLATVGSPPNGLGGVSVAYDMVGRLFQLTQGTGVTRFDHLGSQLVTELSDTNVVLRRYVYGPGVDDPLVWYEGAGTTDKRWLIPDERGSVIAVTNATGGLVTSGAATGINRYDEYGVPASTNLGRFQYTGQAWLPELGLYYYKARMYAPTLGRFMQTDPIGYGDGVNWHNYVGGDPVNFKDPSGLREMCWTRDASYGTYDSGGFVWVVTGRSECASFPEVIWETLTNGIQDRISLTGDITRALICSSPSIEVGFGGDFYAGLGGSVGVNAKIDIASGQVGVGFNVAVGAGFGAEAGPSVGVSPSGSGVVSANVTTSFGGGFGIGGNVTRNWIGTDPGQTSASVGRVGTPVAFVNGGASAGFSTPKLNPAGCKGK